jgi:hypothetical protein
VNLPEDLLMLGVEAIFLEAGVGRELV